MVRLPSNINDYDNLITKAWKKYLADTGFSPALLKAQLLQESWFKIDAVSPVGAQGIAQFMPGTWTQMVRELGYPSSASPNDPEYAINAAAYYMNKLWNNWKSPRPNTDRYYLALASYNAGLGNILKAQKKSGGKALYEDIIAHLPSVTGKHAKETIGYIKQIKKYNEQLMFQAITK